MARVLGEKGAHPAEAEQLIEEIRDLIQKKGLGVELVDKGKRPVVEAGCARCTMCPCMICW